MDPQRRTAAMFAHDLVPSPVLAPCPVKPIEGPDGWQIDIPRGPWLGFYTPLLEEFLAAPPKAPWPTNIGGHHTHTGRVGPWVIRVASDGSVIARAQGTWVIPVPLVLTGPGAQASWGSGKACWDALPKDWLSHALMAVLASLAPYPGCPAGTMPSTPKAWALWWKPGRWVQPKQWAQVLERAMETVGALMGTHPDRSTDVYMTAPTLYPDGQMGEGEVVTSPTLGGDLMKALLRPLLARTGACAQAWTSCTRSPGKGPQGAALIHCPIGNWQVELPLPTAHATLGVHTHPDYAPLRALMAAQTSPTA